MRSTLFIVVIVSVILGILFGVPQSIALRGKIRKPFLWIIPYILSGLVMSVFIFIMENARGVREDIVMVSSFGIFGGFLGLFQSLLLKKYGQRKQTGA